jgi:hypothetical protein
MITTLNIIIKHNRHPTLQNYPLFATLVPAITTTNTTLDLLYSIQNRPLTSPAAEITGTEHDYQTECNGSDRTCYPDTDFGL